MSPSVLLTVVLCDLLGDVWGGRNTLPPRHHPNVSSGDLLEYSDYSDPITPVSVRLPPYMRYDHDYNINVMFTVHYGEEDKVVETTKDDLLITKRKDLTANLSEIWHIRKEDDELKQFFSRVLDLDPSDVTIVHVAFSKTESVKKFVVKERVMSATDILAKLIAAEGKTF